MRILGAPRLRVRALLCGGLYLLGTLLGSVLSSVLVTNKMPLELMQIKK